MTVEEILKSRSNGIQFNIMLSLTEPHATYPGKVPAQRVAILRHLERLDGLTREALDTVSTSLRSAPRLDTLSPDELYMLRQRLLCALDFLTRLADSMPNSQWLHTTSCNLEFEDQWLLVGIWKEFGIFWLQNLAWRISKNMPEIDG